MNVYVGGAGETAVAREPDDLATQSTPTRYLLTRTILYWQSQVHLNIFQLNSQRAPSLLNNTITKLL